MNRYSFKILNIMQYKYCELAIYIFVLLYKYLHINGYQNIMKFGEGYPKFFDESFRCENIAEKTR